MSRMLFLAVGMLGGGCVSLYGEGNVVRGGDGVPDMPDLQDLVTGGYPTAVCSVSPAIVAPLHEAATWDGTGSFDEGGFAITEHRWELVSAPDGNAGALSGGGAVVSGFVPQLAGEYVARLTVTNERGNSSECEATLTAVPMQDLWVEMYWERSGDDMDLHLLAPDGVILTDSDCYFANCVDWGYGGLDWGTSGESSDDPALDLDDIPGTGPENINIDSPVNGVYTVVVHDYPGSVYADGNNVTINVYLAGVLEWSDTRPITTEDSFNSFAQIDWTTKTVTGM